MTARRSPTLPRKGGGTPPAVLCSCGRSFPATDVVWVQQSPNHVVTPKCDECVASLKRRTLCEPQPT